MTKVIVREDLVESTFKDANFEKHFRKNEIHGLKDILVRENDNRVRETEELRMAMELGTQQLAEMVEKEKTESKKRLKTIEEDLEDNMKKDRKDMLEKLDTVSNDMKKKIEMETNEIRYVNLEQR